MQQEIEAKFLDIDHAAMRKTLESIGATLEHPMRLMKRAVFDYPDGRLQKDNWARLRVRDEGNKITVTFKRGGEGEYSEEHETTVGAFKPMVDIISALGLVQYSFQESKRETWLYGDVEIVLDEWPYLKPYVEVEGPTEAAIKQCVVALGLDWADATFGNVDTAYRKDYPGMTATETVGSIPKLTFGDEMPQWLQDRTTS